MTRRRGNAHNKTYSSSTLKQSRQKVEDHNAKTKGYGLNFKCYCLIILVAAACVLVCYHNGLFQVTKHVSAILHGVENESSITKEQPLNSQDISHNDIPEEIKNFKPQYQKTFSVKKIFADGRRIPPVQLLPQKETNSSVKLYLFDDLLSDWECDGLIKAHNHHIKDMASHPLLCFNSLETLQSHLGEIGMTTKITSEVFSPGTLCLNASFSLQIQTLLHSNWSYSTAFYPKESKFSTILEQRIKESMGLHPESGGKFQITSYPIGKAYKTHTDCTIGGTDLRDRVASVIIYLNDVKDGGETKFPELGISVTPKKGRALVWNNMSPEGVCEPHSKHVASIVKSGSKYILIRWYYYKNFYSIGKRMPGPSLPPRDSDVPMVMCDVYTHGSCRWYDEWMPMVMSNYARNKKVY